MRRNPHGPRGAGPDSPALASETPAQANVSPDRTAGATSGRWTVFEVRGSDLVSPLAFQPAVVTGPVKGEVPWLNMSVDWYKNYSPQNVFLAASGPKEWERVKAQTIPTEVKTAGSGVTVNAPEHRPIDPGATALGIEGLGEQLQVVVPFSL